MDNIELEAISPATGIVPEGPIWSEQSQCLYWPDIVKQQVSRYCPRSQTVEVSQLDFEFSAVAECDQQLVLVANNGLYSFDFDNQQGHWLIQDAGLDQDHRLNDAKVDCLGRLWVGSLRKGLAKASAGIYSIGASKTVLCEQNYTAANGLGWSPDNQWFYMIDTVPQQLYRYEFDALSGRIANKQLLIDFNQFEGKPDGMCVDSKGNLWVAMWDGYAVLVFDSEGQYLHKLEVPAPRPTCVTFGGENLDQLYITTASFGLDDEGKKQYPLAGAVLRCTPGITGLQNHQFVEFKE